MLYIVGLGNPEEQYHDTPHNIGWQLVQSITDRHLEFGPMVRNNNALVSKGTVGEEEIMLLKPLTYMNRSGEVFRMFDHKVDPGEVVVVYDDIDLPFGAIKLSRSRGDGGHNGIKSIEQHLGSRDFIRIRVGVCPVDWFGKPRKPKGHDAVSRYLINRKLSSRYVKQYGEMAERVHGIVESLASRGYQKTVSQMK